MESPLRHITSEEYASSWLKHHLGISKQPSQQRTTQQHRKQQQQHLNTLGLRLNAAGNIKPSVIHMPSVEQRWKINYTYKPKVLSRSVNDDTVITIDAKAVSQRNTGQWTSRSGSAKRSTPTTTGTGKEGTRARSAASATTLARSREQRTPRIRAGTPELVTTTPIRLLGVLRSPEHVLNWRGNDGRQQSQPRYFTFPPVTGSRVRLERRDKVSTAPVESRLRSGPENKDPLTLSRSSSSESLPSSWKYADGRQTTARTGSSEVVTDDRTPHVTEDQSTETCALPTISEEDAAAAAEINHSISVRINSRNSIDNRYNNIIRKDIRYINNDDNRYSNNSDNHYNNNISKESRYSDDDRYNDYDHSEQRLEGSGELRHRACDDGLGEDSDSLSVYDDDESEGGDEEEDWTIKAKTSLVPRTHLVDSEDIRGERNEVQDGDQREDHSGHQHGDQHKDQYGAQNGNHIGHQQEELYGDKDEDLSGHQQAYQNVDQNKEHYRNETEEQQNGDNTGDQNDDHSEDQKEEDTGDQSEDRNEQLNAVQNGDLTEDQKWNLDEKADPIERSEDDTRGNETWTKEETDLSPTQQTVYPPLTSRGRASDNLPIPRDLPTASQSQKAIEITPDVTDSAAKVPVQKERRQMKETDEVEEPQNVRGQGVKGQGVKGQEVRGQEVRGQDERCDDVRGMQNVSGIGRQQKDECSSLAETADENNNVLDSKIQNEATKDSGETTATSGNTETVTGTDSTTNDECDNHESLEGNVDGNEADDSTAELPVVISTDLGTDNQSDHDSKVHPMITDYLLGLGQQNNASSELPTITVERPDNWSEENVSLESTVASQEERRSPLTRKAGRKRSVRFSVDVATVYLYRAATPTDDSETSDSGFLSP